MNDPVSIALCGAGGYAERYIEPLLAEAALGHVSLAGIIEPSPERCPQWERLKSLKIPLFSSLEEFFASHRCELLIVASPIHFHCQQACLALANGAHVLCEKPLCTTLKQIELMKAAERASGKNIAIGYQWSFSPAVQRLKADILSGRFGAATRFRSMICQPRGDKYYGRNRWAGRQHLESGELLLDSPVSNAAAHFLHNMLYVLGPDTAESAQPRSIRAELWRAHRIENYDTAVLQIETTSDVKLHFVTSHATQAPYGPTFVYEFEKGIVEYASEEQGIVARLSDGDTVRYGSPDQEPEPFLKLQAAIATVRSGARPLCGVEAASAHTRCVHMAQQASPGIRQFPESLIQVEPQGPYKRRYVRGLQNVLHRCYLEETTLEQEMETLLPEAIHAVNAGSASV